MRKPLLRIEFGGDTPDLVLTEADLSEKTVRALIEDTNRLVGRVVRARDEAMKIASALARRTNRRID